MSHDLLEGDPETRIQRGWEHDPERVEWLLRISREAEERAKPGYNTNYREYQIASVPAAWNAERIYPLSCYSKLMTVPPNVRPDWLAGAVEVIDMIRGLETNACETGNNLEWAEKARLRLIGMFPHLGQHEWTPIGSTAPSDLTRVT